MANFDLFDMVGLAFDPPETNAKQVKKKIDRKREEIGSALGRETQQTNRDAFQAQIDYLDGIVVQILSPDGKKLIDSAFKPLADKKTADELSALSATVELLVLTGGHTVTESTVRHYKKESRLSVEHVKKVFIDAGFEIIDKDPLVAFPKFPTNADRIYSELAALRRTKDPNPNGADTSVVLDLYSFAAYISNDVENIALYRAMETKELWAIFDPASRKYSQRNDDLGKLCGSLSAAAKTYVFNSDENRAAYERHLLYRSSELTKLFATLKKAPDTTLQNPRFADPCIECICEFFSEFDVALAIYNKEAELDPPYIPLEWKYVIKCSACGFVSQFESETEAMKANACKNCRRPLFKKCDKCKRLIPAQAERCPYNDCGYVFASAALFSKHFQQAEAAFRRSDFNVARQFLFKAQTAAPGEKQRIAQLSKQIDEEEKVLKEPINRLRQLIAEHRYHTARIELGTIIRKYPNLNIEEFNQIISEELIKADERFSTTANLSVSKKADVCISILMQCVDYPPALSFLQATMPLPCSSITVMPVSDAGIINISWGRSVEQGVSYRLIRKLGKDSISSEKDGEILIDQTTMTSFTDEGIKPGRAYTYSVFAVRWGVYSLPVSKVGMLYADVKNCHVSQHGEAVRITWDTPNNSRGATIVRSCDGKTVMLTDSAHGSYEDSTTQYGKTYNYKVFANYDGSNRSKGVESVITPLPIVESFSIRAIRIKENVYKVSWSIKQRGIVLRVMVNGKVSIESKSDDECVQVNLPKETYCKISVLAFSGGEWITSENSIDINTYTSCGIDKNKTCMEETMISGHKGISYRIDLKIHLSEKISSNVSAFYYVVRTAGAENRWPGLEDVGKSDDIQKISLSNYLKQGYIPYQDFILHETTFFISVYTCYFVGDKEIVSNPQRLKIDRPLKANLFWSVTYGMFDGLQLTIEMIGNKQIEYIPELFLCVCDANQFIMSKDDKNAQIIMKIPSYDLEIPTIEHKKSFSANTDLPARYLKKCKYFLFEQDVANGDNITLRWKQGFSGKI